MSKECLDHETHEKTGKARTSFVRFGSFAPFVFQTAPDEQHRSQRRSPS